MLEGKGETKMTDTYLTLFSTPQPGFSLQSHSEPETPPSLDALNALNILIGHSAKFTHCSWVQQIVVVMEFNLVGSLVVAMEFNLVGSQSQGVFPRAQYRGLLSLTSLSTIWTRGSMTPKLGG